MTLALICVQGRLPRIVADAQEARPLVCVLAGFEPDGLAADLTFHLETLGTLLATLKSRGVTRVCLCGAIRRPPIDPARLDDKTAPLVPRLQTALTSCRTCFRQRVSRPSTPTLRRTVSRPPWANAPSRPWARGMPDRRAWCAASWFWPAKTRRAPMPC